MLRDLFNIDSWELVHRIILQFQDEAPPIDPQSGDTNGGAPMNGCESLKFCEVMRLLSIVCRGRSRERYALFFWLSDGDCDGMITRSDAHQTFDWLLTTCPLVDRVVFDEHACIDVLFDNLEEAVSPTTSRADTPLDFLRGSSASDRTQSHQSQSDGDLRISLPDFLQEIRRWELRARFIDAIGQVLASSAMASKYERRAENHNGRAEDIDAAQDEEDDTDETPSATLSSKAIAQQLSAISFNGHTVRLESVVTRVLMASLLILSSMSMYVAGALPASLSQYIVQEMKIDIGSLGLVASAQAVGLVFGFFSSRLILARSVSLLLYQLMTQLCANTDRLRVALWPSTQAAN